MPHPLPISVYGRIGDERLFRIDGAPIGSNKYSLALEMTDFRGNAWAGDFTLSALITSFSEIVPEPEELLSWLSALPFNEKVELKEDGKGAWIEAKIEDAETIRLPPVGCLTKASDQDAGIISAGIAFALFEDLQRSRLDGRGARRSAPQSGAASQGRPTGSQLTGSPGKSPHKVARTSGMASASQSQHPDAQDSAGGTADSGDEPSDQEQEGSQPVVDDGVPEQQRHRIVRGRGRGRTPFGAFGRGRR